MANITITIDNRLKRFLEDEGFDVTDIAQKLLDSHLDSVVVSKFKSKFSKQEKIDEITKTI